MRLHRPAGGPLISGPRRGGPRGVLLLRDSLGMRENQVWLALPALLRSLANQERKSRSAGTPPAHDFDRKSARKLLLLPTGRQHRLFHPGFSEEEGRPLRHRIASTARPREAWLHE